MIVQDTQHGFCLTGVSRHSFRFPLSLCCITTYPSDAPPMFWRLACSINLVSSNDPHRPYPGLHHSLPDNLQLSPVTIEPGLPAASNHLRRHSGTRGSRGFEPPISVHDITCIGMVACLLPFRGLCYQHQKQSIGRAINSTALC